MEYKKKNPEIINYFINKKYIKVELPRASFINLPIYGSHIGFWISRKFIYPSAKYSDQVAIGIKKIYEYEIKKYLKDDNGKINSWVWKTFSGQEILDIFDKHKKHHNYLKKIVENSDQEPDYINSENEQIPWD